MFRAKRRVNTGQCTPRSPYLLVFILHAVVLLVLTKQAIAQQERNVTVDDSDPSFVQYAPSTSWHASTLPCSTCLEPPHSGALKGTWHDGTHIVFTIDADDLPESSTVSSPAVGSKQTPVPTPSADTIISSPSMSTAPPAATAVDDDDDDDDDDGNDTNRGRGHQDNDNDSKGSGKEIISRDSETGTITGNPFFTTDNDSDDEGFEDIPVTATFTFNGTAIYLFAIIPLFSAPANTTPTWMELDFTLDSEPFGKFISQPGSLTGAPTNVSSSEAESNSTTPTYEFNVPVFQAADLTDEQHTLVVNVGPDTVFLFDYAIITQGEADFADSLGASTKEIDDSTRKHDVETFVGAVLGSVGVLSVLALGLCISIRTRRRHSAARERRQAIAFAQQFTAQDHGATDADEESGGGLVSPGVRSVNSGFVRGTGIQTQPSMAQALPAPFVPRYFPGTLTSPPPYIPPDADEDDALMMNASRNDLRHSSPTRPPMTVAIPPPMLDLERTVTGSSYADRPPPTPPDIAPPVFGAVASEAHPVRMNPLLGSLLHSASTPVQYSPLPTGLYMARSSLPESVTTSTDTTSTTSTSLHPTLSTRRTGSTESLPRLSPSPSLADVRPTDPIPSCTSQTQSGHQPTFLDGTQPLNRSSSSSSRSPPCRDLLGDVPDGRT